MFVLKLGVPKLDLFLAKGTLGQAITMRCTLTHSLVLHMLKIRLKAAKVKYVLVVALQLNNSFVGREFADAESAISGLTRRFWRLIKRHHLLVLFGMQWMTLLAL